MRRVTVAGVSGSGKTTFGRALAQRLGVPYVELDALHHGPNWTETPTDEFRARVLASIDTPPGGWVVDGNYRSKLEDLVLAQADTFVWLEPTLRVSLGRLARRTWQRWRRREELWHGNRELLRNMVGLEGLFALDRALVHPPQARDPLRARLQPPPPHGAPTFDRRRGSGPVGMP